MNHKTYCGTPTSSKPILNNNESLFHDFVRPRNQFAAQFRSSPFKVSPQSENLDFIPLSYSSPVQSMNREGSRNWNGSNRKSFGDSPANSSCNTSFSPYSMNRKHFHNSRASSNGNSSFSPCNSMGRPRKYSSNRKRRVNNFSGNSDDIDLYYHPSMLEDPWAELEQKLQNSIGGKNSRPGSKNAVEESVPNLSSVDLLISLSDSDEVAHCQETDCMVSESNGSL